MDCVFVLVVQCVERLRSAADREELPAGKAGKGSFAVWFPADGTDSDEAILRQFYEEVPVNCREDFHIEVRRIPGRVVAVADRLLAAVDRHLTTTASLSNLQIVAREATSGQFDATSLRTLVTNG